MLLSFILLVVGLLTSGLAVLPRLWSTQGSPGLIFWERVSGHSSGASYWTALTASTPEDLSRHVAEHVYDLAKVARAKYRLANVATNVTLCGAILGGALLVLGK
ncbi:Pycsar system effector family protein [Archangium sp.]|uniref:Pycsar system effector family protein n=1 Tax=Archangium sp. TaxID=1872627 RepID=UPI002D741E75|nr:Pycsar system effector family protein [Archangium sp.]HYO56697.1 Pycsar system effector family protein [Archangium sp.]